VRIRYLDWDHHNIEHIRRHHVSPQEVEEVCKGRFWFRRGRDRRHLFFGQTYAGRYLFLVMREVEKGVFRPITARDMTERERQTYRKKVR